MEYSAKSVNAGHRCPRIIRPGHFTTRPGYRTIRDTGSDDWLFIYTLGGKGRIGSHTAEFFCEPGDAVCYSPGLYHDYGIADDAETWEFAWAHFFPWPHWTSILAWPAEVDGIRHLCVQDEERRAVIGKLLRDMACHSQSPDRYRELRAMNVLEQALLMFAEDPSLRAYRPLDGRIEKALRVLHQSLETRVTVATVARECNLSPSHLAHLFKKSVGIPPMKYLEHLRLSHAVELLELSAFAIGEIARMCGYDCPLFFSRQFSRRYECSPSAYRKLMR